MDLDFGLALFRLSRLKGVGYRGPTNAGRKANQLAELAGPWTGVKPANSVVELPLWMVIGRGRPCRVAPLAVSGRYTDVCRWHVLE